MAPEKSIESLNKEAVHASFDRWRSHRGSPYELLAPEAVWTIVGSSLPGTGKTTKTQIETQGIEDRWERIAAHRGQQH